MRGWLNGRGLALAGTLAGFAMGWACAALASDDRLLVGGLALLLLAGSVWRLGGRAQARPGHQRLSLVHPGPLRRSKFR